jgi:hypothetical protein
MGVGEHMAVLGVDDHTGPCKVHLRAGPGKG